MRCALGLGSSRLVANVCGLAMVIALAAACGDRTSTAPAARAIPAAAGCTNPSYSGPPPGGGLEPRQIAAAYGIDRLWDAGYRGQGMRVALIEPGERLDLEKFRAFSDCWGPFDVPHETVVGGGTPAELGGEPNFDSQVLLALAPGIERLDLFESATDSHDQYALLLAAALEPANTGGELVDAMSISFGTCEAGWSQADVDAIDAQLRRAAELGVKVFVAGGDSGSLGSYPDPQGGPRRCVPHPVPREMPFGVELAIAFPASSPWATAVGGTELAIDGRVPEEGAPAGGTVTNEIVWNQEVGGGRFAGGGGMSTLFPVIDAPWQRALGIEGRLHRPDVSAMAGSPKFPNGGIGTSGASPLTAAGIMVVDSFLAGHGVEPPGFLTPVLYDLARTDYERVFVDVVDGSNDVYRLGCCDAAPGYDTASGLGSIRFDRLAEVLLERARGR
ncbi:MAG: hypothetical protein AB1689_04185 [Thermodesulfobacteriota bacterium]